MVQPGWVVTHHGLAHAVGDSRAAQNLLGENHSSRERSLPSGLSPSTLLNNECRGDRFEEALIWRNRYPIFYPLGVISSGRTPG
ncbi:hypothetical protein MT418_008380, partial [Batrachochytrium dendrobatidis]